jgi:colicin import membrane protein
MNTDLQAAETMAPLLDAITSVPAVIPRAELIFVPGGAARVLDSIKDKARAEAAKLDVSRPKDRKAIISLSMDLRHLKVAGDESGKTLKAEYQAKITPIDAERRVWREEMDALADEIRRPVTEFEQAEETRIREHEAAVADLVWPKFNDDMEPASVEATALIDALDHMHVARQWQEFSDRAAHTRTTSRNALLVARMNAEAREKAEAEAARLAEEAAEAARQEAIRLQAEREAEIARQAAEAARMAAEAAAAEEAARVAAEADRAAQRADYHRRMLQHVKNCGFGFIDEQPQPLGILQHELVNKIKFDEDNFGDLLAEAIAAKEEALAAIQRSIDESNRRAAQDEATAAALAKAEAERQTAADALAREQEKKRQAEERAARLEAIRIADRKRAIAAIPEDDGYGEHETSAELELRLRYLRAIDLDTFDEFVAEAGAVLLPEIERTSALLTRANEREAAAAAEKARRDKIAAEALAEAQRLDAERREQAAIEAERQRVEGERIQKEMQDRRDEEAARKISENKAHQRAINRAALDDLIAMTGLHEPEAKEVLEAIIKGQIRHVSIKY